MSAPTHLPKRTYGAHAEEARHVSGLHYTYHAIQKTILTRDKSRTHPHSPHCSGTVQDPCIEILFLSGALNHRFIADTLSCVSCRRSSQSS